MLRDALCCCRSVTFVQILQWPLNQLTSIIPPVLLNLRPTRHNLEHHPHYLDLHTLRTSYHSSSFFPRACQLWNSLPPTVFPSSYNLQLFKTKTNEFLLARLTTLHSQWELFIIGFYPFVCVSKIKKNKKKFNCKPQSNKLQLFAIITFFIYFVTHIKG